ncbi:MAG: flagellar basal body-associated protein FliL [Actinomycetota bacterium]
MIRVIFIVVAFLLLIGAVIGGLYFWGIDPLAPLHSMIATKTPPSDAPPPPPAASYVDFGILTVPVIQDREVKKQADMVVRLEVDPGKKELVANNLPRLQAAFLEDMIGFLPLIVRDNQPLDVPAVRRRLQSVGDRVLVPGMIKSVVIENPTLK